MTLTINHSIAQWHEQFERHAVQIKTSETTWNSQLVLQTIEILLSLEPAQASDDLNRLFELHVRFFVLNDILKHIASHSSSFGAFIGFHTHVAINDLHKSIHQLMAGSALQLDDPTVLIHLNESIEFLRPHLLVNNKEENVLTSAYFWIWRYWISPVLLEQERLDYEQQCLLDMLPQALNKPSQYAVLLAQCWTSFYSKQDEEALLKLAEMANEMQLNDDDVEQFVNQLIQDKDWSRLHLWLVELGSLIDKLNFSFKDTYFRYWDLVVEQIPESEPQMWEIIEQHIHFARTNYRDKLLMYGKWEKWAELVIALELDPLQFRASELTEIEKKAPHALLPFYHQAVERYVWQKNRRDYKAAAKLLKRIARIYKKTKKVERWEQFIQAFAARHSRLRALQEELKKGNLLT